MPAGVVGGIAVASSVAGTVATVSAQQRQARIQEEAALQQALDAEERAQYAIARQQQVKESAQILRQRQLALVSQQRREANLALQQNLINNRLSQIQVGLEANTLRAQGQNTALQGQAQAQQVRMGAETEEFNRTTAAQNQLVGRTNEAIGAIGQQGQVSLQNANQLSAAQTGFDQSQQIGQQLSQQGRQNSQAGLSAQEQSLGAAQDVVGNVNTNAQQSSGMAAFNTNQAMQQRAIANKQLLLEQSYGAQGRRFAAEFANTLQNLAATQGQMSNLAATSIEAQQSFNDAAVGSSNAYQRQINSLQAQRNRKSTQAGYQSAVATGNISALGQVLQEQGNIANALYASQQARASAPSGLSYLGALANGVSSAYQLGLFGGSGNSGTPQPQPQYMGATVGAMSAAQSLYSPAPQQSSLINTYPPGYTPQNPTGLINFYPPQSSNLINTYPPGYPR